MGVLIETLGSLKAYNILECQFSAKILFAESTVIFDGFIPSKNKLAAFVSGVTTQEYAVPRWLKGLGCHNL